MKYYISFDSRQDMWVTSNPYEACLITLRRYLESYTDALPLAFRVSKRGFDIHDEDEIITTEEILKIKLLANQTKENYEGH